MDDIRQRLLALLKEKPKGLDIKTIQLLLKNEANEDFILVMEELHALVKEYSIVHDPSGKYLLSEYAGFIKGTLRINAKGFGFVENETQSFYVSAQNIKGGLQNDIVFARTWTNFDETSECEVMEVIERNLVNVVGTIRIREGKSIFLSDAFMNDRRFKITNIKDFKLVDDTKVMVHIDEYTNVLKASIVKVLGHKYDPGIDILSTLLEHHIEPEFPQKVLDEVNKIPDHVLESDKVGRINLCDKTIITIDGEDSRDLDDAISVECIESGYRLGVHIADVSYYVREGMEVNSEAYDRGTSVYVVDRVVPMIPHSLSNGICSLNPKVERLTITCEMDIDGRGNIIRYAVYPSYIKTSERMTYTDVNAIIACDEKTLKKYPHLIEMCSNMVLLSDIIRKRRIKLGAIDFDSKEAKIIVNAKGKPTDIVLRERGRSELIIEDFMIAANECVASHVKKAKLPSIYRVHEEPDAKKIREFAKTALIMGHPFNGNSADIHPKQMQTFLNDALDTPEYPVLSTYMLRSMQKARYDANCLGHFGLALEEYTHFTSPIRRYPDLIVHRMLRKYYFDPVNDENKLRNDLKWIEDAAIQCSKQERNAIEAERDVDDMKKAEYMEKYIGCIYDGVISSIMRFGMFVELDNTVEGLIHISNMNDDYYEYDEEGKALIGRSSRQRFVMGQKVRVKVIGASRFKKQVDFILVKGEKKDEKITQSNHDKSNGNKPKRVFKADKRGQRGYQGKQRKRGETSKRR
ncbi:MAG: ribonuclease R [Erysipelotrichaceae bacterium]